MLYWRITRAKEKLPYIRRLPLIDAIEEAVGRAAEVSRPFFATISGGYNPAALAGAAAIGHVATKCAEMGVPIITTAVSPNMIPLLQARIEAGYTSAGVPELAPKPIFLGAKQAWMAGNLGIINREKPAGSLYLGGMGVESMQTFEACQNVGAVVFGGTTSATHFPFVVTACDYWVVGEEVYAVGAYISKTPADSGVLEGQDYAKYLYIAIIALGLVSSALGSNIVQMILGG